MHSNLILNKTFIIYVFILLTCVAYLQGQSEKNTSAKIKELRSRADFKPQDPAYIDLLLKLAKAKIRTDPDSTSILLKEGYDLSLESNYKEGVSTALSTYGYLYFEKGEVEKAHEYNMKALDIANTYNLGKEKLKALNNMGLDFLLQGKVEQALPQFLEALAVAKEINDIDMMVNINVNIANIYSDNEDYETALTFLEIARKLSKENENEEILAYTLLNMATIYSKTDNFSEAQRMVDKSIVFFEEQNSIDWLSHAYEQRGSILLAQNKYTEALDWFLKAKELCDQIDFKYGYTILYNRLAECYLELDSLEEAKKYALKGLEASTDLNIAGSIMESNSILSKTYHALGQDKVAYRYQSTYQELYEKSSTEKFKKGLGILRSKTEFENQKRQLIEDKNKAISKQKNYVYLSISALIIVSFFSLLIYRTNQIQKKYTKNLQEKQDILIRHKAELSESNKTKDKLFSIIAHDLKGPINSFYELMKMSSNESISKDDYDTLFPQALRDIQGISEMLNNLLVWARTQMKGIVLAKENLDVYDIVDEIVSILTPLAQKKEIRIINNVPKNTISFSDENHLKIIIRNLISNAIKFTNPNGRISLGVKDNAGELQLEVSDTGVGMDPETQAMLFEKKPLKPTFGTNNEKGTGLGLSICKEMIENNGGRLWVSSKKNIGTTVYFTVPAAKQKNIAAA